MLLREALNRGQRLLSIQQLGDRQDGQASLGGRFLDAHCRGDGSWYAVNRGTRRSAHRGSPDRKRVGQRGWIEPPWLP